MNNCSFVGTLGRDWEVKFSQDGKAIAKNSMAIRKYNGESFWLSLTIFGKRAESAAQYSGKGDKFGASGSLDIQDYEKDGHKKSFTSLLVSDFDLLGAKKDAPQSGQQQQNRPQGNPPQNQQQQFNMVPPDEGMPF